MLNKIQTRAKTTAPLPPGERMKNTKEITHTLSTMRRMNRPDALVNAAGYLILAEMRLDPANPAWRSADVLFYSASFADMVHDAFLQVGFANNAIPTAGFADFEVCLTSLQYPRRLFCLADAADAERISRARDGLCERIVVISAEPPLDAHRWRIHHVETLSLAVLNALLGDTARMHPLWIVAPIAGSALYTASKTTILPQFANRMGVLGTETAFDVLSHVNRLRAEGRDIISFGLGEPDFDTPAHIKTAAKKALDENHTHYTPSAGIPELRAAIARYIQRTRRIPADADEVVVTPGAKPIVFDVMMALVNPGDEVLYPNPGYPIYESVADWIGAKSTPLPLAENRNWGFSIEDLETCITPKTKLIVINTPGNPTGAILAEPLLRNIARLALKRNFWVIADEVYSQIVFEEEFCSIAGFPGMKERTIIVDGFSKTYAMTGWRMGYGVMNRDLAAQVARIETNIDSCTCAFSQIAGIHALDGPQHESQRMIEQFHERAKVIVDGLNAIDGVRCLPAQGAFYVFPNVTAACRRLGLQTANQLQAALLEHAGVAVLPRTCFGRKNQGEDQEYIRLSFATSMDNIREGLRRIKQFIEK